MQPAAGRSCGERVEPCCVTFLAMDSSKLPPAEGAPAVEPDVPMGSGDLARVRAQRAWRKWDQSELAVELAPWPAPEADPKQPPPGAGT